jgi:hypothetical protein
MSNADPYLASRLTHHNTADRLRRALRRELLRLAQHEDDIAASEAEQVHYWEAMPTSVTCHRQTAAALRAAADELLADPSG